MRRIRGGRLTCSLLLSIVAALVGTIDAVAATKLTPYPGSATRNNTPATVYLQDIDSGTTSPTGDYRWLDIADQQYSSSYRTTYNYTQATVQATYETAGVILQGTLTASNLKPNFAYQLKLVGTPGTLANERIGLAGRWWQEEWGGSEWSNGQNLNNKGDGSSPNPNDNTYFTRRDIADETSPTGLKYSYTGYLVYDYLMTDSDGHAILNFETNSSYHVLWKTSQRAHSSDDGPIKVNTFDPDPSSYAYDTDYGQSTVSIFGEWERLPIGGVYLQPGEYTGQIILTEESFHGSGGSFAGNWAAAMGAPISFYIHIEPSSWESYSDSNHYTQSDMFDDYSHEHIVYMHGTGFEDNHAYRVAYYDGEGNKVFTEDKDSVGSGLTSQRTFRTAVRLTLLELGMLLSANRSTYLRHHTIQTGNILLPKISLRFESQRSLSFRRRSS